MFFGDLVVTALFFCHVAVASFTWERGRDGNAADRDLTVEGFMVLITNNKLLPNKVKRGIQLLLGHPSAFSFHLIHMFLIPN